MRIATFVLLCAAVAAADVVVLKDGRRVAGRVAEKATHVEVDSPDAGLRTFLKEEVDRIVKDPKEFLGDADARYAEAKKDFEKAVAAADDQALIRQAIVKVTHAREAYAEALDLFPDDDRLGKQLMLIMQLMRLLRERVSSEMARRPSSASAAIPPLAAALKDPAKKTSILADLRSRRPSLSDAAYDLATAAILFQESPTASTAASIKAVQDHFDRWLAEPEKLTPESHLQAAQAIAALKAKDAAAAEALAPFAAVHAAWASPGPDAEKAARALGLAVAGGKVGTAEGHAVADLVGWMRSGDHDLAVLAFVKEHRGADTPSVRYVWSAALLQLVVEKRRGWDRPVAALNGIQGGDAAFKAHVAGLAKAIKAAASCNVCQGEGKIRCTNCHGKKQILIPCARCKGKGKTVNALGTELLCNGCKATGYSAGLVCRKCQEGFFDCRQCDAPKPPPELGRIVDVSPCEACDGRGLAFLRARIPCRTCYGLGEILKPL